MYWIWAIAASAVASTIVTWIVVRYGKRLGIIDDPRKHVHASTVHKTPVPRGGGIPIFISLLVGITLFVGWDIKMLGIAVAAGILTVWGIMDDQNLETLSPYVRLIFGNFAAALAVIGVGIGISYINNPLGGVLRLDALRWCFDGHCLVVWADIFAILWLVSLQNVVGWSTGVDGQLPGFVAVAAITMMVIAGKFADPGQMKVILLAAVVAGAYIGFLPWNWYPQKIMPGYGGKTVAGLLLGVLAILSEAKVGTMIMVLGIPIIDGAMVVFKRLREGRSPVWGGREHLHHWLLQLGWGRRRIATFYMVMSILLGLAATQLQPQTKLFTMTMVAVVCGGAILWLQLWLTSSKQQDPDNG